jgi:hypothetical protein
MTLERTLKNIPEDTLKQYCSLVWGQSAEQATSEPGSAIQTTSSPVKRMSTADSDTIVSGKVRTVD